VLKKCVNPECSAQFRYLHEGKLFCLVRDSSRAQDSRTRHSSEMEWVWLCSECAGLFKLVREESELSVIPLGMRARVRSPE